MRTLAETVSAGGNLLVQCKLAVIWLHIPLIQLQLIIVHHILKSEMSFKYARKWSLMPLKGWRGPDIRRSYSANHARATPADGRVAGEQRGSGKFKSFVLPTVPLIITSLDLRKQAMEGHQRQSQQWHLLHLLQGRQDNLCHLLRLAGKRDHRWNRADCITLAKLSSCNFSCIHDTSCFCWVHPATRLCRVQKADGWGSSGTQTGSAMN